MSAEIGATAGTAVQAPVRAHVKWKEVVLFVVLAYGLAWAWSGFFLFPYLVHDQATFSATDRCS